MQASLHTLANEHVSFRHHTFSDGGAVRRPWASVTIHHDEGELVFSFERPELFEMLAAELFAARDELVAMIDQGQEVSA